MRFRKVASTPNSLKTFFEYLPAGLLVPVISRPLPHLPSQNSCRDFVEVGFSIGEAPPIPPAAPLPSI